MTQDSTAKAEDMTEGTFIPNMEDIVSLCKRRGFIFKASDIYGGINGFWDYGPLGVALKNNIRDLWWRHMVEMPPIGPDGKPLQIVGLDSSIIQNPKTWEASGHLTSFSDPMVDCRETKLRYRQDHLILMVPKDGEGLSFAFDQDTAEKPKKKKIKKLTDGKKSLDNFDQVSLTEFDESKYDKIVAPDTTEIGTLTAPKAFNLMFKTYVGATATEDDIAYLRPETAQGIFLNFKNIVSSSRVKIPFGIAQIGKSFRNEVTPRNFIFRSREFEQMEIEWFCHEDDAKMWLDFWIEERKRWWNMIGISDEKMILRQHDQNELAHYSKDGHGTVDIEYRFPFSDPDYDELEGVAHRGNYDLAQHQEFSGTSQEYLDQQNNNRFLPHVIEPAAGLTRAVMAVLAEAYTKDENRPSGMYMNFTPAVAPIKAAILPLTAKDGLPEIANDIYLELRKHFVIEMDVKQSIGKRYARHDEIGTPFCITVDNDTKEDKAVTIRHRNTMKQDRVAIDKLQSYITEELSKM